MEVDPAALTHFCGEGASVALQGHQLRLQPSDAGTARVETKLTVGANTRYRLSGRITSEDGNSWGHIGVINFDGQHAEKEQGSQSADCTTVTLDFQTNSACEVVLYAHAFKQQSGAVLVDSISLHRADGQSISHHAAPADERPPVESNKSYNIAPIQHLGYLAVSKALYVWNPGGKDQRVPWGEWTDGRISLLVAFCSAHRFSRVIVFIGSVEWEWDTYFSQNRLPHESYFIRLFAALRLQNITPHGCFYLNDDVNDLTNAERAADVVSSVVAFNAQHPDSAIAGLDGDQEPNQMTEAYHCMNRAMVSRRDSLGVSLELAVSLKPAWLGTESVESAMQLLGSSMVMAYSSDEACSQSLAARALAHGTTANCKVSVAIETSFRAPASDSFWELVSGAPNEFFDAVTRLDQQQKSHSHYSDLVIHDYEGYFRALHGADPIETI